MVKYKRKKREYRNRYYENKYDKYGNYNYSCITLPDLGNCKLMIMKGEETDIPHFHIVSKKKGINITLNIFTPEYNHDSNYNLTYNQLEIIQNFIFSDVKLYNLKGSGHKNFEIIYSFWENINSSNLAL